MDVDRLTRQLGQPGQSLAALYVITGDDPLLTIEAADTLRAAARRAGYTERTALVMDARSDWSQLGRATGSGSLFGDRQLLEISIPTGKPGKQGAEALMALAEQHGGQYVALVGAQLISTGKTFREANEAARAAGCREAFVTYLPKPDEVIEMGGWL